MRATTPDRKKLTVPEIAKRYGVNQSKVLRWIADDELRALNVASTTATRPRWRIDPADLEAFEASRANTSNTTKATRSTSRRYR